MSLMNKLKRIPLFAVFFTYVFVMSAVIVSMLCFLLLVVVWPFSKNAYRRITSQLAYSILGQMVWVSLEWADLNVHLYGKKGVFDKFGKESCLITLSHRGDLDWVAGYVVGAHMNFLHTIRTLPKRSVLYVPGFGQLLWALECPFLTRNFAKDENTIKKTSEVYKDYPFPIQVCIFCEGSRFTEAKHEKGLQFAREKGLKELKHHLIPRTKGFSILAKHLKTTANFPALYDVAFAYPTSYRRLPSFIDLLLGRHVDLHFYMRRIPMDDVPATQEELSTYCYKLYEHKDEVYEYFLTHGVFPTLPHPFHPTSRMLWGLRLNLLFWTFLLSIAPMSFLMATLSWAALGVVVIGGVLGNALMMLAIIKYARSNPAAMSTKKTN